MANYVKKIINAGGMTESQSNKILELARNKSWELEPRQNYRERSAMLINDIENNPASSPLTGGWHGTASKFISYLMSCPNRNQADIESLNGATSGATMDIDPWAGEATEVPAMPRLPTDNSLDASHLVKKLVGPGVYVFEGRFYSVKESTKNPGRHYAHLISLVGKKFKHEYAAGIIFKLTEEMRADPKVVVAMNMDTIHVDNRGRRVGSCCVCGRMLTKKSSVDAGIGPICGGRVGI